MRVGKQQVAAERGGFFAFGARSRPGVNVLRRRANSLVCQPTPRAAGGFA